MISLDPICGLALFGVGVWLGPTAGGHRCRTNVMELSAGEGRRQRKGEAADTTTDADSQG